MNGSFRTKKINFTQVSNHILRDEKISLKAKGLYALIQSYITIANFILYKSMLQSMCIEGEKAFQSTWNELKEHGYLIQHKEKGDDGRWIYEYELLDIPDIDYANNIHNGNEKRENIEISTFTPDPQKVGCGKGRCGKGGVYNNTYNNNTYSMYVCMYESHLQTTKEVKNFIANNHTNIDIDLFERIIVETINNKKISKKDAYIIKTLKELIKKNIKSNIEYDKFLEIYKNEKKKNTKTNNNSNMKYNPNKTSHHNVKATFMNYTPEELEARLKESQKGKF